MCAPPKISAVPFPCTITISPSLTGTPAHVPPRVSRGRLSPVRNTPKHRGSTQHKFVSGPSNSLLPLFGTQPFQRERLRGDSGTWAPPIPRLRPLLTYSPLHLNSDEDREILLSVCVCGGAGVTSQASMWDIHQPELHHLATLTQGRLEMGSSWSHLCPSPQYRMPGIMPGTGVDSMSE